MFADGKILATFDKDLGQLGDLVDLASWRIHHCLGQDVMGKRPQYDEYDPWTTYDPGAPVIVRRNPKRICKPTLASVLKQADKAGVKVASATVKPDGSVALEFGRPETVNATLDDFNEWDVVLQ